MLIVFQATEVDIFLMVRKINPRSLEMALTLGKCLLKCLVNMSAETLPYA